MKCKRYHYYLLKNTKNNGKINTRHSKKSALFCKIGCKVTLSRKAHQNKNLPKLFSGTVEINPPLNAKACIKLHQLYPTVVELSYSFQTQYVFFF